MYAAHFGLRDLPFSISPDPGFIYMSPHHQEALAHLLYGMGEYGGFVQLTGEVGTGKTTLIRALLEQHIDDVDIALSLNPRLTVDEFVAAICDELGVQYPPGRPSLKSLIDALNRHLLASHARGRRTVLVIDEAQNLSSEVLEQIRLLTNLETHRHKLLRIILVGQPELDTLLKRNDLRQLAQRITARYHLAPLNRTETDAYINHRLQVAGAHGPIFSRTALALAYRYSGGVPRLINIVCDRALMGAYGAGRYRVGAAVMRRAARESLARTRRPGGWMPWALGTLATSALVMAAAALLLQRGLPLPDLLQSGPLAGLSAPAETREQDETPGPVEAVATPVDVVAATSPVAAAADAAPTAFADGPVATLSATAAPEPAPPVDPYQRLAELWERPRPAPDEDFCLWASEYGLRCLHGGLELEDLRRFALPVILTLSDAGEEFPVLVLAMDRESALVDLGDQLAEVVPLGELARLWTGRSLLLWQPPVETEMIGPSSRGEDVRWLREQLARARGGSARESFSDHFDGELQQQVRQFQEDHGLQPDGLVGTHTLIVLSQLAGDGHRPPGPPRTVRDHVLHP